jgi:hypothetical protein
MMNVSTDMVKAYMDIVNVSNVMVKVSIDMLLSLEMVIVCMSMIKVYLDIVKVSMDMVKVIPIHDTSHPEHGKCPRDMVQSLWTCLGRLYTCLGRLYTCPFILLTYLGDLYHAQRDL